MGWAAQEVRALAGPGSQTVTPAIAPSGLLGRADEAASVARALEASRLVTLTGAPGIGKTRLALAVAAAHADPVAVAELAGVGDGQLLADALATALSVPEMAGQAVIDAVVARLRTRPRLLLLDNCEHLRDPCAEMLAILLRECPSLSVLATSREPLRVEDELVWSVPPLSAPPESADRAQDLLAYPAVALFVERAAEADPGFALNGFVARDVAEICRRLDGIPLAIELAARRIGMLTPGEIAARLDERLLRDTGASPLPRHRTLDAAIDWSHALLTAPERALFRRLAVFAGRFEPEAAEAICAGREVDPPGVAKLLDRLVAKSLVAVDADAGGQVRHRLLETIRVYAAERLADAGEVGELRSAHARFYLSLAERAEPELTGPHQQRWLERLEAERANLRVAIEWSLSHGRAEPALRLAGALVLFWRARSHFSEGRELLEAALAASDGAPAGLTAKALWGSGFLMHMAGESKAALAPLERSLGSFRELGDGPGAARALLLLANAHQPDETSASVPGLLEESARLARDGHDHWALAHALGVNGFHWLSHDELRRARPLFEECVAVARAAGDVQGLRFGLIGLGQVAADQGEYLEAESIFAEAVELARPLAEDYDTAVALTHIGSLEIGRGNYSRARSLLQGALTTLPDLAPVSARTQALDLLVTVAHAQGDLREAHRLIDEISAYGQGVPLVPTGWLALEEGDRVYARALYEVAYRLARSEGKKRTIADALHGLGWLARLDGDSERAAALQDEALDLRRDISDLRGIAASLESIAALAADARHDQHAARLLGAARAIRDRGGFAPLPWEAARCAEIDATARESLTPVEFDRALSRGAHLSLEDALAAASQGPAERRPINGRLSLTKREREVLELLADGATNTEITEVLTISFDTVKRHVAHVFEKLGVNARSELTREIGVRGSARKSPNTG